MNNLRNNFVPAKNTPIKPIFPKSNQDKPKNRSVSPIYQENRPVSKQSFNFFNTPTEGIQVPKFQIPASNLHNLYLDKNSEILANSGKSYAVNDSQEKFSTIYRKNNRHSLDRMTDLTLKYLSSKPQKSVENISVDSYKVKSVNRPDKSPPYKLLKSNKLNQSQETSSMLSTVNKREVNSLNKFQEIQRRFLNRVANDGQILNSGKQSSNKRSLVNNGTEERRFIQSGKLHKESIIDSDFQDIDNGGAIVDLKLVQPSVNSSNRNVGIFGDKMYFSTQENIFESNKKSRSRKKNGSLLSRSKRDRSSVDTTQLRKNQNDGIFSFRDQNLMFNKVRNNSQRSVLKESVPVLKLRNIAKRNRNSSINKEGEMDIPYEGSLINSNRSKEQSKSSITRDINLKSFKSELEKRTRPRLNSQVSKKQRSSKSYLLLNNSNQQPLSLLNIHQNSGYRTAENSIPKIAESKNSSEKINFDLGKNSEIFQILKTTFRFNQEEKLLKQFQIYSEDQTK